MLRKIWFFRHKRKISCVVQTGGAGLSTLVATLDELDELEKMAGEHQRKCKCVEHKHVHCASARCADFYWRFFTTTCFLSASAKTSLCFAVVGGIDQ